MTKNYTTSSTKNARTGKVEPERKRLSNFYPTRRNSLDRGESIERLQALKGAKACESEAKENSKAGNVMQGLPKCLNLFSSTFKQP